MSFVEFYHMGLRYRLSDELVCTAPVLGSTVSSLYATSIMRAALSGWTPILATQIRSKFAIFDGGRAGAPTTLPTDLANRIGLLVAQGRMTLFVFAEMTVGPMLENACFVTPPNVVTADQLRLIAPNAGSWADTYVDHLNTAMALHGIASLQQQAAFLAQLAHESQDLTRVEEDLRYRATTMVAKRPDQFPTVEFAQAYVGKAEAFANRYYANMNGNGDEASGDGYRFRGRGLIQLTGRGEYTALGYAADPDALTKPAMAADSAANYWKHKILRLTKTTTLIKATENVLGRAAFDQVSKTVNGGDNGINERWTAYQSALRALNITPMFELGGVALPP